MNIFKCKAEMPPKDNSNDPLVVRVAQTLPDMRKNYMPSTMPQDRSVENIQRPRRGHDY